MAEGKGLEPSTLYKNATSHNPSSINLFSSVLQVHAESHST